jgi:hypothetical protein
MFGPTRVLSSVGRRVGRPQMLSCEPFFLITGTRMDFSSAKDEEGAVYKQVFIFLFRASGSDDMGKYLGKMGASVML